jgi:hypothetical protein
LLPGMSVTEINFNIYLLHFEFDIDRPKRPEIIL